MSTMSDDLSVPELPAESAGSSVSTSLQKEYEDLLRYAVVTPKVIVPKMPTTNVNIPESTTTTETSSESYEHDSGNVQQEVTGLPSTPDLPAIITYKNPGIIQAPGRVPGQKSEYPNIALERAAEHKEKDDSFTSDQSATPDDDRDDSPGVPSIDADLIRMESQLDSWCSDMKRNILAEFAQCKMALLEGYKQSLRAEKQRHAAEINRKQNDIENLKELLYTYEKTMDHKDNIIANMTKAIQKQKERFDLLRRFNTWKIKHVDEKKESFGTNLAKKHHNHVVKCKIWSAWRSLVETRWKQKVEKACQSKAQDVCVKLTDDYEAKLQEVNQALDAARLEVSRLHAEREIYEETMKKAFMRGVCALNLEAMHMFREPGDEDAPGDSHDPRADAGRSSDPGSDMSPRSQPPPRPTASTGIFPNSRIPKTSLSSATPGTMFAGQPSRTINVKAVGRADFRCAGKTTSSAGPGLPGASTISSVLVERHSGPESVPFKPPIRNTQPSQNTGVQKTARIKGGSSTVRLNHVPPVKVVH